MKGLTVIIAALSLSLASGAATAGSYKYKAKSRAETPGNEALSKRKPQVRGYLFRPGGHSYDFEYEPILRRSGPYGNYPDLDQRTFNERVLSDPRYSTTSPSAF